MSLSDQATFDLRRAPLSSAGSGASGYPSNLHLSSMANHPPIPIMELADHLERLKANDNLKFSQEYEVAFLPQPPPADEVSLWLGAILPLPLLQLNYIEL
ncbi:receptor-type tyrosine-protein phosphatase delta-like isoform X1 [Tachysurus ichikawai]